MPTGSAWQVAGATGIAGRRGGDRGPRSTGSCDALPRHGASGTGKSTVREILAPRLGDGFDAIELHDLGAVSEVSVAWRQERAQLAAEWAARNAVNGRHLLLSGNPVAAGEIVAPPDAVVCGGVTVCLLDADEQAQTARLRRRGDPADLLPLRVGFAAWMREHAEDPTARSEAITAQATEGMRWDRLVALRDDSLVLHPERW